MENKSQSVFEKLDNQDKKIEEISSRLEGISINDLYALAKRTWEYGDFQTAQKYYNHISFLRPLDWEAPLYASLCNFHGFHEMFFWVKVPEQIEKIIVSTIEYINNLDLDNLSKELEIKKCIEIVKREMCKTKEHYLKYKEDYDIVDTGYVYALQKYFLNIINKVKYIESPSIKDFVSSLAEELLDLIENVKTVSSFFSNDILNELNNRSLKKYNFDKLCNLNKEESANLTVEEIKEIKINGKMYFEYNDKIISKRLFIKKIIISSILLVLTIAGIVFSMLSKGSYYLFFVLPFLYAIFLLISAIVTKDKIKCSSLFISNREKNRLTSNGNIVTECKKNIFIIIFGICSGLLLIIFFLFSIIIIEIEILYKSEILILGYSTFLTMYIVCVKNNNNIGHSKFEGKYSYVYKGKTYFLNK